ncbi:MULTISPECIES: chemotaxis protein CheD [Virgibacillus]|uniref:Probable chemoreceptor glutamine deamidase CheD n=1 Tax=Virgibacillus dokdonensis TaxID=302167 RepID=A0A2K9J3Y0_9BACI|nr:MULTISPECIES: chemotaxis protein CheD [Virgibacillus]AUJ26659.1 Chemoreceptor glutamine deamidase CheD [Virgibacillus dokdonensis]NWO12993.1 chemotaxis protein CheD [Virgibacillus sp.]
MSKLISSSHVVKVGIADLKVTKAPNKIRTSGLGSCVGVVIYDERKKVAGLAHVLLPDSKLARQNKFNHYKYADTAIPLLVEQLSSLGARSNLLKAKVAGGAQMFQFSSGSDMMRIGPRNVESVLEKLKHLSIPVLASDTGGNAGRTIEFDIQTSLLKVRTVNKGETFI